MVKLWEGALQEYKSVWNLIISCNFSRLVFPSNDEMSFLISLAPWYLHKAPTIILAAEFYQLLKNVRRTSGNLECWHKISITLKSRPTDPLGWTLAARLLKRQLKLYHPCYMNRANAAGGRSRTLSVELVWPRASLLLNVSEMCCFKSWIRTSEHLFPAVK